MRNKDIKDGVSVAKPLLLVLLLVPIYLLVKFLKVALDNQKPKFEILDERFDKSDEQFANQPVETKTYTNTMIEEIKEKGSTDGLTPRQKRVFSFIEEKNKVEMGALQKKFRSVTVRTLRRDLKVLSDKNLVKKIGSTKGVSYQMA